MANENVTINFKAIADFGSIDSSIKQLQGSLSKLKLPADLSSKIKNSMTDLQNSAKKVQDILGQGIKTKGDYNALQKATKEVERNADVLQRHINKINNNHIKVSVDNFDEVKNLQKQIQQATKGYEQFLNFGKKGNTHSLLGETKVGEVDKLIGKTAKLREMFTGFRSSLASGDFAKAQSELDSIVKHMNKSYQMMDLYSKGNTGLGRGTELKNYFTSVQAAMRAAGADANKLEQELKEVINLKVGSVKENVRGIASNISADATNMAHGLRESAQQAQSFNAQLDQLKTSANYFFGLQNMFYLMRRGLRETLETVKELDKAMTETAVVTDYKVSEMWNMLPDYTELANKLGATIQGSYETMTLYFQQGLDKQATFEIGEETMKMARIAGLDYAETTNMMTAALRGFNMELNQTSAKRVNDVYSKLAAITASDTKELGLAMERTASIAHSANMDFGTTTAFLAQMIETTREAPENLGTAMKTIIARFQELKENPMEIGEVDGEEVSFNRVDKALKTIGVQLVDSKDKFRDLDDVFLDIAEKWDGLTQTQQRYIATTAAGSRQQSRFIAMMANYKRTIELVDAAANSEGASEVQFSKTLDSMEAKLNALSNAWKTFMMGITDSSFLKTGVDLGTSFLNIIQKIINGISGFTGPLEGATKSILSLGFAIGGLKIGGKIVNKGLGFIGNLVDPQGQGKGGMFGGLTGRRAAGNAQLASQISNPIVTAINNLRSALTGQSVKQGSGFTAREDYRASAKQYNQVNRELTDRLTQKVTVSRSAVGKKGTDRHGRTTTKANSSFSLNNVQDIVKDLSENQQTALYNNSPILRKAIEENFSKATNHLNLSESAQQTVKQYSKYVSDSMASGKVSFKNGIRQGTNLWDMSENLKETAPDIAKQIKDSLYKEAMKTAKDGGISKEVGNKIRLAAEKQGLKGDAKGQWIRDARAKYIANQQSADYQKSSNMRLARVEGGMMKVGNAASAAGQSVMGLGMALSSAGFTTAGSVLTSIGSGIQGIGMSAQNAYQYVGKIGKLFGSPIFRGGLAVAGVVAIAKGFSLLGDMQVKKIRKDAKEVEDTYKKTTEKITRNLSKLNEYKSDFERLAEGVDSNGYNIDLGTEEYKDYQKIVKDLARMNPEIVEGYNAQGQAIINKNSAIEESIKLQQREQKETEDEYTKASSLTKLINSRNTTKRFDYGKSSNANVAGGTTLGGAQGAPDDSQFKKDAQAVVDSILDIGKGGKDALKTLGEQYNVDFLNLNDAGIRAIQQHGSEMMNYVTENITTASETQINAVQDSIATLGKHTKGFEEVVKPVYENLSTYISKQQVFKDIPEEYRSVLDDTIKEIAGKRYDNNGKLLTGEGMQKMAVDAASKIQDLKGHSAEYKSLMEEVSKAQEKYSKTLDANAYNKVVNKKDGAIDTLKSWKKEFDKGTSAADKAMSEWVNNQIEKISNFTQEGTKTLAEGFNTMSSTIESSHKAYERFQEEGKKGDYYTGVENFKSIYDDVTSDKNWKGASQTMYRGAFELLGQDNVIGKSAKQVKASIKEVGKYLTEGKEGVDIFLNDLRGKFQDTKLDEAVFGKGKKIKNFIKVAEDGTMDFDAMIDFDANQMESMATSLGLSLETFTALLDKARQFYNLDFSNPNQLRETLATSETTLTGAIKKQQNGEKSRTLYTKKDAFEQEAILSGVAPDKLENIEKNLQKTGVVFMNDAAKITRKQYSQYFKDWGINNDKVQYKSSQGKEAGQMVTRYTTTADQFVKQLFKSGYDAEEVRTAYKQAADIDEKTGKSGAKSLITDADTVNIEDLIKAQEEADNPVIDRVETTNTILSDISSKLDIQNGVLTEGAKEQYQDLTSDKYRDKIKEGYESSTKFDSQEEYSKSKNLVDKGADETKQSIDELRAIYKNSTDPQTKAEAQKLIKELTQDYNRYVGWQGDLEKGWGKANSDAFGEVEKKGYKVEDKTDRKTLQDSGVELRNLLNQPFSLDGAAQFTKLISGLSQTTQESLNQQYVNDNYKNLENMSLKDFNSLVTTLGPVNKETQAKLDKVADKLEKNTQSTDKNTKSKEKKTEKKEKPAKVEERRETGQKSTPQSSKPVPQPKKTYEGKGFLTGGGGKQKQSKEKQQDTSIWKKIANLFNPSTPRKGPAASSVQAVNTKSAKKNRQESKVDVKVNDKTKKATTDIKNRLKNIKSPTLKFNIKGSAKKIEKIGKAAKDASKDKKLKITADTSSAKKKADEILQKGKDINKADPKLKVSSSFNDKAVDDAKALDGKTLATSYVKIITQKTSGGKGNKKNKNKDKDNNSGSTAKGRNNKISSQSYNISSAAKGKDNEEDLKEKKIKDKFDSAAKGKRGKGGMTLTGELGYEVAWFPSESRSTILGLDGPEMVKLPSDAVVYNHEQSKKIVAGNKKRPNVGSMVWGKPNPPVVTTKPKKKNGKGSGSSGNNNNSNNKTNKENKKTAGKWSKAATIWMRVSGKVNSWWDNISRKIEATRRTFDQSMKTFNKVMSSPVVSLNTVFDELKKASKTAANAIAQQIAAYEKARDKLLELDTGKPLTKTDKANKKKLTRYEQLKKKGKKRTKKENKEFKKLRKWGRGKGFINKKSNNLTKKGKTAKNRTRSSTGTSISYEKTGYKVSYKRKKGKGSKKANKKRSNLAKAYKTYLQYKKDNSTEGKKRRQKALAKLRKAGVANKKGKLTKKGKKILKASKVTKTQTDKVNLAKYIKFDKQTGAYVIDDDAINKDNKGNKKRGQAIRDKANELLEEYTQKRNDALDALADLRDQFIDVGDQIYEKFYAWKSTLEEIELVTQRIAEIQAKSGVATAYQELISNQILTGITKISLGLGNVNSELEKTVRSLTDAIEFRAANNEQLITKARTNRELESNKLERTYSDTDEENAVKDAKEEYDKITNYLNAEAKKYGVNADENGLGLVWGADLYGQEIAKQQAALRKYEAAQQEQIITVRAQEILGDLQKREDGTYAFGNSDSEIIKKIQEMESDTSLTNELKDAIQTRVQELQEGNSKIIQTVTDEIEAANDTLKLVFEMQEYLADIEQKIGQVLVERDQRVVDNLSKINDSIKNTTTKILDGVRESLDKRRQQDQNAKTEKSIQDKQTRLAYLQSDSAGGHQVEIAQLRKEIGDEQQGYRETLEDQLLSNLQKQADQAAAQRERQISLLQTQIEYDKQNGIYAKQINDWLSNPIDYQTEIHDALTENDIQDKFKTSYTTALSEANVSDTMVKIGAYTDSIPTITEEAKKQGEKAKKDAEEVIPKGSITTGKEEAEKPKTNPQPIPKTVQEVNTKLLEEEAAKQAAEEKKQSAEEKYTANLYMRGNASKTQDINWGKIGKDKLQEQISLGADLGKDEYSVLKDLANTDALTWKQVLTAYKNLKGEEQAKKSFSSFLNGSITKAQQNAYQEVFGGTYKTTDYNKKIANAAANKKIGKAEFESIAKSAQEIGIGARTYMQDLANTTGLSWKQVIKAAKDAGYSKYRMAISFNTDKFKAGYDAVYGKGAYAKNLKKAKKDKAQVYQYKTGGLADYTGPAWMDGTKSKPELVLDAQDTKNFIALKDTLGKLNTNELGGASTGDLNFDIDINVDKIDNDYDVRRIVDVVKKEITKNAGYRNVKIVRNMK